MSRLPFIISAALVALGLVTGTALDPSPPRVPVYRGTWRVLEADFHSHTRFSDGLLSPLDLVVQANRRGLDVLAVTEHDNVFPAKMARWFAAHTGGPTILVGEEITTGRYHVIALGLQEAVDPRLPLTDVLDRTHAQHGIVVAAHPVAKFWPSLAPVVNRLDGAEVMHPLVYGGIRGGGWRGEDLRTFYENAGAGGHPLTAIGASDYHFFSPLGVCRTLVFIPASSVASEDAVMDALEARRTVVYDLEGHAYGDPDLIALLEHEPYTVRAQDYGYRGEGTLDRAGRTLAWLGMLGFLLFNRRRTVTRVLARLREP